MARSRGRPRKKGGTPNKQKVGKARIPIPPKVSRTKPNLALQLVCKGREERRMERLFAWMDILTFYRCSVGGGSKST